MSLRSVIDEMVQLREELSEIKRQHRNLITHGYIAKVKGEQVNVDLGEHHTGWIYCFQQALGNVRTWRQPVVGESCLVINVGGGHDVSQAFALLGLPAKDFPAPSNEPNLCVTDYGNGMKEMHNLEKGIHDCHYPGGLTITGDVTINGNLIVSGESTSSDHVSDGVSGKGHTHGKGSLTSVNGQLVSGGTDKPD